MTFFLSIFAMIPSKVKLYGMIAIVLIIGLLGWRAKGINNALEKARNDQVRSRLDEVRRKKEIDRETDTQDDSYLVDRASRK